MKTYVPLSVLCGSLHTATVNTNQHIAPCHCSQQPRELPRPFKDLPSLTSRQILGFGAEKDFRMCKYKPALKCIKDRKRNHRDSSVGKVFAAHRGGPGLGSLDPT